MIADRVNIFPAKRDNEAFAHDLAELARVIRYDQLTVSTGCALSPCALSPCVLEVELVFRKQKVRAALNFSQAKFTPENVKESFRELLARWKKICLELEPN